MDVENLIKELRRAERYCLNDYSRMAGEAATDLSTLQAENEKLRSEAEGMRSNWYKSVEKIQKLRAELEQVTLENNALWTYIEIVDREYRRYMDRGYIDRLDELRRTWRRGQKED